MLTIRPGKMLNFKRESTRELYVACLSGFGLVYIMPYLFGPLFFFFLRIQCGNWGHRTPRTDTSGYFLFQFRTLKRHGVVCISVWYENRIGFVSISCRSHLGDADGQSSVSIDRRFRAIADSFRATQRERGIWFTAVRFLIPQNRRCTRTRPNKIRLPERL